MMNVGDSPKINPALLNDLAPLPQKETGQAGPTQIDLSSLVRSQSAQTGKLAELGLTPPNLDGAGGKPELAGAIEALKGLSESSAPDIFAMMALFQQISQEQRNAARMERQAGMEAQVTALLSAADKIKEAAAERFAGALAQGISQIASGAISVAAGGASIAAGGMSAAKSIKANDVAKAEFAAKTDAGMGADAATGAANRAAANLNASASKAGHIASSSNGIGQGLGGMVGGIGTIVQASFERKAAETDAEKARLEADAKVAETGVQHANEVMQQMMDIMRDIREKLGAIEQSRNEANRGIARNI